MPGKSWKKLSSTAAAEGAAAPKTAANDWQQADQLSHQLPDRLTSLLRQRQQLENNLRALTTGGEPQRDPREAARFPVSSFAQRRAEQKEWELTREARPLPNVPPTSRTRAERTTNTWLRSAAPRTGLKNFDTSVDQWAQRRDSRRENLRDRAHQAAGALESTSHTLSNSLDQASRPLRDLDNLNGDISERDRQAIKKDLDNLGVDKLRSANQAMAKAKQVVAAPSKAIAGIDRFWKKKEEQISGPMDRASRYAQRSRQRLSTTTGGSGDIFSRMQRNRDRALARRREQRLQEEQDEARRQRALSNKIGNKKSKG